MECTVTSQLDYIMNIIITLRASWHALDRACCLQRLTERLRKKKTDTEGLVLAYGALSVSKLGPLVLQWNAHG